MSSTDFQELMKHIHQEKCKINKVHLSFGKLGMSAEVELETDNNKTVIKSSEPDFFEYVSLLQKVANEQGDIELAKIRDGTKYYSDINFFIDSDKSKMNAAIKKLTEERFVMDFDADSLLDELLFEPHTKRKKELLKLKQNYYEIFARELLISKSFFDVFEKFKKDNPASEKYSKLVDELMGKSFRAIGTPIKDYRFYREYAKLDFNESLPKRISQQMKFLNDQHSMLSKRGGVAGSIGIGYVLDAYRRILETSFDLLNIIRIGIELINGNKTPAHTLSSVDNVRIIRNSQYSQLVTCVDPYIRHSESHTKTIVDEKTAEVIVMSSKGKSKEIARYSFKQIADMTNELTKYLFPALFMTLALHEFVIKNLIYTSPEYKLLLIKLEN